MTPEVGDYLCKARQALSESRAVMMIDLTEAAGRTAYLAMFHAAQALIFDRTGSIAKTHSGVRSEFARISKDDSRVDREFTASLAQAHVLKEIADHEMEPNAIVPRERAAAVIESAEKFIDCISGVVASREPRA